MLFKLSIINANVSLQNLLFKPFCKWRVSRFTVSSRFLHCFQDSTFLDTLHFYVCVLSTVLQFCHSFGPGLLSYWWQPQRHEMKQFLSTERCCLSQLLQPSPPKTSKIADTGSEGRNAMFEMFVFHAHMQEESDNDTLWSYNSHKACLGWRYIVI